MVQWFDTQTNSELSESCPCCRHAAGEHEQLPTLAASEEEDDDDDEDEDDEDDSEDYRVEDLGAAAARERAVGRFSVLKRTLTKEELATYAATKITACVRGFWARRLRIELSAASFDYRFSKKVMMQRLCLVMRAKRVVVFHRKAIGLSRLAWKNQCAKTIQSAARDWIRRKSLVAMALEEGMTIVNNLNEQGEWVRSTLFA